VGNCPAWVVGPEEWDEPPHRVTALGCCPAFLFILFSFLLLLSFHPTLHSFLLFIHILFPLALSTSLSLLYPILFIWTYLTRTAE